tara:strand:+ start:519 stop:1343 length:825 start_codon:yes stop_codon:yes gene_type:complete
MAITFNGSTGTITESNGTLKFGTNVELTNSATLPASALDWTNATVNGSKITGNVDAAILNGTAAAIDGSAITSLSAGNLTGSIADARLPSNIQSFPAPGTSGNTLQSDGTNWTSAAAGAGGAWEVVQNGTIGGATLILGSLTKTTRVIINKYHASGSVFIEYSTTGGNSFVTSGIEVSGNDAYTTTEWTSGSSGFLSSPWGSLYTGLIDYTIFRPEDGLAPQMASFQVSGTFSARGGFDVVTGSVRYNTTGAINRLRFTGHGSSDKFIVLRMTY